MLSCDCSCNVNTLVVCQIEGLLKTASKNRAVGETQCNERSSRSHSVFRLRINGTNTITSETCAGTDLSILLWIHVKDLLIFKIWQMCLYTVVLFIFALSKFRGKPTRDHSARS